MGTVLRMKLPIALVTGSNGRIGKEVIARLAQSGRFTVRATVHNPANTEKIKAFGAHEVVSFDYDDQNTWADAFDGVTKLFSSSPDSLIAQHMDLAKQLGTQKNIDHVVRISCFGADENTNLYPQHVHVSREGAEIPLMLQHYWWSEQCLIEAGLPTTSIRGNFFMNHLLKNETEHILEEPAGWFESPLGECKNSFVCTNDMGEAAAVCMLEGPERHANKFYDITGPEPQSMYDVARVLGEVMGKEIKYCPQDIEKFEKDFGPARAEFFEYLRNGFYTRCSPDFYNITGRRPTTYKEYLTTKGASGETGLEELFQAGMFTKGKDAFAGLKDIKK